jgi:hypothetical protein
MTTPDDGYRWPVHSDTDHAFWYTEYWYFNFTDLDTGRGGMIGFGVFDPGNHLGAGRGAVTVALFEPHGTALSELSSFPLAQFDAAPEHARVWIGPPGADGRPPNRVDPASPTTYHVSASTADGRVTAQLVFEQAYEPVLETENAPGTRPWEWNSWLIYMPAARVSGTVTRDGTTWQIANGAGYHDHSWGVWLLPADTWAWGVFSNPAKGLAGVLGYHCAFEHSQAFVLVPDAGGSTRRIVFPEANQRWTPEAWSHWKRLWKYPTRVRFEAIDASAAYRLDVTWTVTATATLWRSPAVIFEQAARFQGALWRTDGHGGWVVDTPIDEPGHAEAVDTWLEPVTGSGALDRPGAP